MLRSLCLILTDMIKCLSQTEGLNEGVAGPENVAASTCIENTDKRTGKTKCAAQNLPTYFLMSPRAASFPVAG